jgi:antitoxin component YwqK of YwqJK toxin-antitoxin module
MKARKILLSVLISLLIYSCGNHTKSAEMTSKFYYLDSTAVDASDSSYYGHFKFIVDPEKYLKHAVDHSAYFHFTTPTKTINIYYDKAFSKIAEKITFTLKGQLQLYQRFDNKGNLIAELLIKNGHHNKIKTWDERHNLNWVSTFNDTKQKITDTTFFDNQAIKDIDYFINGKFYKEASYYRNGKIKIELYRSVLDNDVFEIHYDSLDLDPIMYYRQDSIWEDEINPGTMLASPRLYAVDSTKLTRTK